MILLRCPVCGAFPHPSLGLKWLPVGFECMTKPGCVAYIEHLPEYTGVLRTCYLTQAEVDKLKAQEVVARLKGTSK